MVHSKKGYYAGVKNIQESLDLERYPNFPNYKLLY